MTGKGGKLTDKTLEEASVNPDGKTYDGRKALQWMYEAMTGKALSDSEVESIIGEAKKIAEERKSRK